MFRVLALRQSKALINNKCKCFHSITYPGENEPDYQTEQTECTLLSVSREHAISEASEPKTHFNFQSPE